MNSLTLFFGRLTYAKKIILLLTPLISILISMKAALLGLWFLIFIDLLTGIRKSHYKSKVPFNPFKLSFWITIKSYLLRKTWRKTYEYALGIITIIVLESLILGETHVDIMSKTFTISELSVVVPACVEVWSIYENFEAVSGSNPLKKFTRFASIFSNTLKELATYINKTPKK